MNPLKKLFFWRNYSTAQHSRWWSKRPMNWDNEFATHSHPHRKLIIHFLNIFKWDTLMEVGMGCGTNLAVIASAFKGKKLVGIDVNKEAIEYAKTKFKGADFRVSRGGDDIFMSDNGVEVTLTDMCLIYVGPGSITKVLEKIKKVTTSYVVLCEFHHKSWFKRQWLRVRQGYHSYNYKKLLEKLGFYDVIIYKLRPEDWPDAKRNQEFRHIIIAKVPK